MMNSIVRSVSSLSSTLMLVASLGLLATTGCGDSSGLSNVTGVVTLDGNPYPNAQVRFVPKGGRPSMGLTDETGKYRLHYMRDQFGAAPGSYTVDITTSHTSTSDTDGGKTPPEKIPARYNTKSELIKEVTAGENVINFELTSKK